MALYPRMEAENGHLDHYDENNSLPSGASPNSSAELGLSMINNNGCPSDYELETSVAQTSSSSGSTSDDRVLIILCLNRMDNIHVKYIISVNLLTKNPRVRITVIWP
jgi:hypothetical protein